MTIKEIRKSLGLSQREFAEHFKIPVVNIQHWEQGVSKPLSYVVFLITRVIELENLVLKGDGFCGETADE